MNYYDRDEVAQLEIETKNEAGVLTNPTTLTLEIIPPSGVKETRTWPSGEGIVKDETGKFHALVPLPESGGWQYRWKAEGKVALSEVGTLYVYPDAFEAEASALWFDYPELLATYPQFEKLQEAPIQWVRNTIIPRAQDFINNFVRPPSPWTAGTVPADMRRIAMNYAVNHILADDENVRIAQARAQPNFTVSGDTVPLDLSLARNPLLSKADEQVLLEEKAKYNQSTHTDKVVVKSQGDRYANAPGGDTEPAGDYVRQDTDLPSYFAGQ